MVNHDRLHCIQGQILRQASARQESKLMCVAGTAQLCQMAAAFARLRGCPVQPSPAVLHCERTAMSEPKRIVNLVPMQLFTMLSICAVGERQAER